PPPAQCRGAEREKTLACSPPSSDPGRPRGRRGRPARGPRAGLTTLRGRPRRMRRLIMPASVGRGRVVAWRARSWHRSDVRIVPSARSIEEHPSIIWRTSHARNRQKHREWTSERWPAVGCGSGGRCVGRVLPGAWIRGGPRVHGKAPISAAERGGSGRVLGRAPPPMRGFGDHAPDLWIARSTPARPRAWGGHATAGGRCAHAPKALCVLGSEGSFLERRARLDARLRRSLAVTRAELVRRNIVQGVSVVRRASHALEAWLPRRPPLGALIAAGRLATDYVDRAFPIRRDKERQRYNFSEVRADALDRRWTLPSLARGARQWRRRRRPGVGEPGRADQRNPRGPLGNHACAAFCFSTQRPRREQAGRGYRTGASRSRGVP
ncbi:unnamed protein product, partial [Prorocentrum cordatum]